MKTEAIIYVPSDTPEAMAMAPQKVAGVPLILRSVLSLAKAGITSCTLITAESQRQQIEQFLTRFSESRPSTLEFICYEEPYRVSPAMIDKIYQRMDRRTLLINANLLFDPSLIKTIYQHDPNDDSIFICKEGIHPLPIMEVTKESWSKLSAYTAESPHSIESCINYLLDNNPIHEVQKPSRVNTFFLSRREDIPVAEKFLAENIRRSTNGPVARHLNKRLSLPVSMLLSKTWISPHAITSINIVIGLLAGVLMAGKGYYYFLLGATLFQLVSVTDGIDGEIAKLTFRSSKFGQYIDTVSDNLALAGVLIGLTIGSYRTLKSNAVFMAGGIAIFSILIVISVMIRFLKRNTNSASLVTFDREYLQKKSSSDYPIIMGFLRYTKYVAMKDVFSFMIFVMAVMGLLQYWIFLIALGALLGAVSLTYLEISETLRSRAKSRKKVVVFDFDGTVVNSMDYFADIAAQVIPRYYNIGAEEARQSYLKTSGIPFFQQLETLYPKHPNNPKAAEEFESIKKKSYFDKPVYHNTFKALKELHQRNIKAVVSSNNFQELVDEYVSRAGLEFDLVLGYSDNFAKGEDHFRLIEQEYGIGRDEIAFVGDSLRDGERAAISGISFIGKEGIFTRKDFEKHFPDAPVVRTLGDVKKFL